MSTPVTDSSPPTFADSELETLGFAARVLELAEHDATPLADRCRFLTLVQANVEAFLAVRAGTLHAVGAVSQLSDVRRELADLRARLDRAVGTVLSQLAARGVHLVSWASLRPEQRRAAAAHAAIWLSPGAVAPVDTWQGFPVLEPGRLHMIGARGDGLVHVPFPESAPRLVPVGDGAHLPLEAALCRLAAPEARWTTCRVIRSAEVLAAPGGEIGGDVNDAVAWAVHARRYGVPVQVELSPVGDRDAMVSLADQIGADTGDVFASAHPLDLRYLMTMAAAAGLTPAYVQSPTVQRRSESLFARLDDGDVLVHHPADDFGDTVVRLLLEAASDDRVESLDASLYRLAPNSAVVRALCDAARRGVRVRVALEMRARFDENHNRQCAEELSAAGVAVSSGLQQWKTHAKLIAIHRRDDQGTQVYAHVGTGNYHEGTAASYEDLGLLTARTAVAHEVAQVLDALVRGHAPAPTSALVIAPHGLRAALHGRIDAVMAAAGAGEPASIQIKVNALTDTDIAAHLVAAAQAGVHVDLLVRSACVVRPVPGLRVRSIAGHVLQHSRIYRFSTPEADEVFIGSADLMPRNLNTRVEVLAPVCDSSLRSRLIDEIARYWAPRPDAWDLDASGSWLRRTATAAIPAQQQSRSVPSPR